MKATQVAAMDANNNEASQNLLSDIFARVSPLEFSQNQVSQLRAKVVQLEAAQGQVTRLQEQVVTLEAKVAGLEQGLVAMEDQNVVPGMTISPTLLAAMLGHTSILAGRLARGADPNQDDRHGGTCLVASASYANPECIRLLIEYGADVAFVYSGGNVSILYMLVLVFRDREDNLYRQGDYVLAADLLVEAGAPIEEIQDDGRDGVTALGMLRAMEVKEGSKRDRERRGLMVVLERQ